jgi:hypothetical protein
MIFQLAWENWEAVAARIDAGEEEQRFLDEAEENTAWIWDWASRICPPIDRQLVDQAWRGLSPFERDYR